MAGREAEQSLLIWPTAGRGQAQSASSRRYVGGIPTDDPRLFAYVRPDTRTTAHVVLAPPNEINTLEAYFERAVEDYKRHPEL